jgi:hypothetical protein
VHPEALAQLPGWIHRHLLVGLVGQAEVHLQASPFLSRMGAHQQLAGQRPQQVVDLLVLLHRTAFVEVSVAQAAYLMVGAVVAVVVSHGMVWSDGCSLAEVVALLV